MKRVRVKEGRNMPLCFAAPHHLIEALESDLAALQELGAHLHLKITMSFFLRLLLSVIYSDPELHEKVWLAVKRRIEEAARSISMRDSAAHVSLVGARSG
ncbi:MAG: hypothetical protein QXJ59_04540 [Thermofilaceae archaeon]